MQLHQGVRSPRVQLHQGMSPLRSPRATQTRQRRRPTRSRSWHPHRRHRRSSRRRQCSRLPYRTRLRWVQHSPPQHPRSNSGSLQSV